LAEIISWRLEKEAAGIVDFPFSDEEYLSMHPDVGSRGLF
jgi:hypothetical protein